VSVVELGIVLPTPATTAEMMKDNALYGKIKRISK
jgi:hypothetical protein